MTASHSLALYLLPSSPYPPVSGSRLRSVNLARALEQGHDVTVVALDDRERDGSWGAAAERLLGRRRSRRALITDAIVGVLAGRPALLQRSIRAGCPAAFEDLLRSCRPGLVILGRPLVGPYVRAAHAAGARVVIDVDESMPKIAWGVAHSRRAPISQRLRAVVEATMILGRMERSAYPAADQLWVSSKQEADQLARVARTADIRVIPNGLEMPGEAPEPPPVTAVAFVGWYRYPPNEAAAVELAVDIMPAVRTAGGPKRLVLIGPEPTLAMRRAVNPATDTLTGEVPDVRAVLRGAGVLAAPVRTGGGTRVKILDAIACGVPVVSTRLGIEGLGLREGVDVLLAETPTNFARAIKHLADDHAARVSLTRSAFEVAQGRFSVTAVGDAVASALRGIDERARTT